MDSYYLKDKLFDKYWVRFAVATFYLIRGSYRLHCARKKYEGLGDICWLYRVSRVKYYIILSEWFIKKLIVKIKCGTVNLRDDYLKSKQCSVLKGDYAIGADTGKNIWRDIIVLKSPEPDEKGVILIKYTETFEAFVAYFNYKEITSKYYIVLEPSWAGYCDPSILMYVSTINDVIIQCFTEDDYNFIKSLNCNLKPIQLGPSDWVDLDQCNVTRSEKIYDIIMVANWGRHKRHDMLFNALKKIDIKLSVLLVGFGWGGRTKEDIYSEYIKYRCRSTHLTIVENISHSDVIELIGKSKVKVFLSKKEGDNKSLTEALCCNVPIIVYVHTIGGAKNKVNEYTGIFSSYDALDKNIIYMVENYKKYRPREWAESNTGYIVSTEKLNMKIREIALSNNEKYTTNIVCKINSPNLTYKISETRDMFSDDYRYMKILWNKDDGGAQ